MDFRILNIEILHSRDSSSRLKFQFLIIHGSKAVIMLMYEELDFRDVFSAFAVYGRIFYVHISAKICLIFMATSPIFVCNVHS